ncbi:MAG: AAA family ATPase [Proteobacteria bacterium]|nr:AAA family ATPase [Pseudomonadota bacterium]
MHVGVAGRNAAGKSRVVEYLERRSFFSASLSDAIREDLRAEGLEPTRDVMIERGRALRSAYGPAVLAQRIERLLPAGRNCVIDSIRHPAEVEELRRAAGFKLLWIEASPEVRFERSRSRARPGDAESLAAFLAQEERELGSDDDAAQQLLRVADLADETLTNDGSLAELESQVERFVADNLFFEQRPPWDEYFMNIAHAAATRSNCVKRKVGAIVVVDRRIVSTGYNGTPRGTRNCNEGGCPRCAGAAQSGARLDECLCSHAEENAITQAAYHGVAVRGGAIYSTLSPCLTCAKMIINAGIEEVVFDAAYGMEEVVSQLFTQAGVKLRRRGADSDAPAPPESSG